MSDYIQYVFNDCYGGFGLSELAIHELIKIKKDKLNIYDLERWDEDLVNIVKKLGKDVNDTYSNLKIYDIPRIYHDLNAVEITDNDGMESWTENIFLVTEFQKNAVKNIFDKMKDLVGDNSKDITDKLNSFNKILNLLNEDSFSDNVKYLSMLKALGDNF